MAEPVALAILAAGASSRFAGGNKLLADWRGKPLLQHIVATVAPLPFAPRFAICPADVPAIAAAFSKAGFALVSNPDTGAGQSLSLRLAARAAAASGARALAICLADMPLVSGPHLLRLLEAFETSEAGLVASAAAPGTGPPMPPAIFGREHFPALARLTGDKGARELLRPAPRVLAAPHELADFDTAEDFAADRR